jgi:hypothetical protein
MAIRNDNDGLANAAEPVSMLLAGWQGRYDGQSTVTRVDTSPYQRLVLRFLLSRAATMASVRHTE